MFISNFYGFLLDEFGILSRRSGFSATAELSCYLMFSRLVNYDDENYNKPFVITILYYDTIPRRCHCVVEIIISCYGSSVRSLYDSSACQRR